MTVIYVPRLIEDAEQAEALPDDAIVIGTETGERYTKTYDGEWWGVTEMGGALRQDVPYDKIVALVPVEAEEQWGLMDADGTTYRAGSREHAQRWQQTIGTPLVRCLITPWEEA